MHRELVFFVSTGVLLVLLVPFVSGQPLLPIACAAIRDSNYDSSTDCTGSRWDKGGQTCCWREQVPGKILGETKCQTCKNYKDANGNTYEKCTDPAKQAIKPEGETTGPQRGGVLEDPSNLQEFQEQTDSKRADILADLNDNNMTFAEANNTNND